jgi:hypothetical protein
VGVRRVWKWKEFSGSLFCSTRLPPPPPHSFPPSLVFLSQENLYAFTPPVFSILLSFFGLRRVLSLVGLMKKEVEEGLDTRGGGGGVGRMDYRLWRGEVGYTQKRGGGGLGGWMERVKGGNG